MIAVTSVNILSRECFLNERKELKRKHNIKTGATLGIYYPNNENK